MRKTIAPLLFSLVLAVLAASTALAAMPRPGDELADATVKSALTPSEAKYLGLPEGTSGFRLSQIDADALVVEIYSLYCPICQREARAVNAVFERLSAAPGFARARFVAIGAGNTPYEIGYFRNKFASPMPMFADADGALNKAFMGVRTPSFFVLKKRPGGGFAVVWYREGGFTDEDGFVENILTAVGR